MKSLKLKVKYFVLGLLFFSITADCFAEDISISSDVDRQELSIDEQLTLTIIVSGNVSDIPQPQITGLTGFTAYSAGRSQNISIINGKVSSSVSFTYILIPNDAGEYTLGPFSINYQGKAYSTSPINIKVTPRAKPGPGGRPYSYHQVPAGPSDKDSRREGKELFIEAYVDKLTSYVNEQITLTFAFYQSVNLFENPVYNPPSTTGFWTEDMPPQKKYYKTIDGREYLVTEIKTALFATAPGEFTIGPARLEASIEDLERFFSRSPFDVFDKDPFSMFRRGKPIVLTTDPITIEILPLPEEGRPLNFKGDVGRFDITAEADKNSVEENQPITLKIRIKGEGNIKTVSSPDTGELDNVKVYDSASSENISKSGYIVQGEKIFEKVFVPKNPASLTIGPIRYSYFDPLSRRYIEKATSPISINVTKAKEEEKPVSPSFPIQDLTKEEVKLFKKDIGYIKTRLAHLRRGKDLLYKNKIFLLLNIIPLIVLMLLYIYESHRKKLSTDIVYARSRRAKKFASRRLKIAKNIMHKEDA